MNRNILSSLLHVNSTLYYKASLLRNPKAQSQAPVDFLNFFNVYLLLREREKERKREGGGRAKREGITESEAGSRLRAVSTQPDMGLGFTNHEIMT